MSDQCLASALSTAFLLVLIPWSPVTFALRVSQFASDEYDAAKEHLRVVTGTNWLGGVGTIAAPAKTFARGPYALDYTAYIFILENVAIEGSVQVNMEVFDLHPDSWLTIRKTKYGGYRCGGKTLGRFNRRRPPPRIILSDTCCLRLEFNTGCCGLSVAGQVGRRVFTGFRASYKFVYAPGKGRRDSCPSAQYPTRLCNGECFSNQLDCPCAKYGQYKCLNEICVKREVVCNGENDCGDNSDEDYCKDIFPKLYREKDLGIYALVYVVISISALVGIVIFLVFLLYSLDSRTRRLCIDIIHATSNLVQEKRLAAAMATEEGNSDSDAMDSSVDSDFIENGDDTTFNDSSINSTIGGARCDRDDDSFDKSSLAPLLKHRVTSAYDGYSKRKHNARQNGDTNRSATSSGNQVNILNGGYDRRDLEYDDDDDDYAEVATTDSDFVDNGFCESFSASDQRLSVYDNLE